MNEWDKRLREMEKIIHTKNAITSNKPSECRPQLEPESDHQINYDEFVKKYNQFNHKWLQDVFDKINVGPTVGIKRDVEDNTILSLTLCERIKYKIASIIIWLSNKIGDKNG